MKHDPSFSSFFLLIDMSSASAEGKSGEATGKNPSQCCLDNEKLFKKILAMCIGCAYVYVHVSVCAHGHQRLGIHLELELQTAASH